MSEKYNVYVYRVDDGGKRRLGLESFHRRRVSVSRYWSRKMSKLLPKVSQIYIYISLFPSLAYHRNFTPITVAENFRKFDVYNARKISDVARTNVTKMKESRKKWGRTEIRTRPLTSRGFITAIIIYRPRNKRTFSRFITRSAKSELLSAGVKIIFTKLSSTNSHGSIAYIRAGEQARQNHESIASTPTNLCIRRLRSVEKRSIVLNYVLSVRYTSLDNDFTKKSFG